MHKGFTLLELLIVTAIIVLLTALILPNYKSGSHQLALQRSAQKLAQDIRRAQEMAMSSKKVSGQIPYGFGIHLDSSSEDSYILFADLNNNHHRDAIIDQDLETIKLESGIKISSLLPVSAFSVVFVSPDPTVWINDASSGVTTAQITLATKINLNNKQIISVNNAGLITVE